MMIDLEQLKADRDAGTDGPWRDEAGEIWDSRAGGEAGIPMFRGVTDYRRWGREYAREEQAANARRISRLPDLEAAYIEAVAKLDKAVEALQEVDDTLAKLSGSLAELDAALLAQEIAVIALERGNIAALITAKPERDE